LAFSSLPVLHAITTGLDPHRNRSYPFKPIYFTGIVIEILPRVKNQNHPIDLCYLFNRVTRCHSVTSSLPVVKLSLQNMTIS